MKRNQSPFKWHHFEPTIILLCVRWYCRYSLSYRDLEEMMRERGLSVDHTTVWRWVQRYAPEINKRMRPYLKSTRVRMIRGDERIGGCRSEINGVCPILRSRIEVPIPILLKIPPFF